MARCLPDRCARWLCAIAPLALWCAVVSAWIVGRTLGVPTLLAGLIVLLDMLASDALALYLFEP